MQGGTYNDYLSTYFAKSKNYIATKFTDNVLKVLDLEFQVKETFTFEEKIMHVLHYSKDNFLILTTKLASYLEINGAEYNLIKKIELEDHPAIISSGTIFNEKYLFLHTKSSDNIHEGRIYNLQGKLLNKKAVSKSLK